MKSYIVPKTHCVEIELESLVAESQNGMQNNAPLHNQYNENDQLVKGENSFGGSSQWDNEW